MVEADGCLEHAQFAGHRYGTPAAAGARAAGAPACPVLLEIDLQGARQVRAESA